MSNLFKFEYNDDFVPNNIDRIVKKVVFPISRYCLYTDEITFNSLRTLKEATTAIEKYFSEELTDEYYDKIKDDLFFDNMDDFGNRYSNVLLRGDLLTDKIFYEGDRKSVV